MNAATETSESFAAPATAPRPVRPFYWSVRRELWETSLLGIVGHRRRERCLDRLPRDVRQTILWHLAAAA